LESKLNKLSNDTKNGHIDKERQKLAIFGPCAPFTNSRCMPHHGIGLFFKKKNICRADDDEGTLPRTTKRAYGVLIAIGFIAWIVGLVGVSGTTATCPELSNDFDSACRSQLRMAWFRYMRMMPCPIPS
jgi:hypothetical protein